MEQLQTSDNSVPVEPTKKDYLLGREGYCRENSGNELFRALINLHYLEYQQAKRKNGQSRLQALKKIIELIVFQVKNSGGRFLKRVVTETQTVAWTEMTRKEAMTTVAKGFRHRRREMAAALSSSFSRVTLAPSEEESSAATTQDIVDMSDCLCFTSIFDALHISAEDEGPRRIMEAFSDDLQGVKKFLAGFQGSPDDVLTEYGFTKPLHKKRLHGFSIWFETVYKPYGRVHLNRRVWLDFFTGWVRHGCPVATPNDQQI